MAAVACGQLRWFEGLADEALASGDPWGAFVELMLQAADAQAGNRAIVASMDSLNDRPDVQDARAAAAAALQRLMDRAKRQGAMRADAQSREVWVLFGGVGRALSEPERGDVVLWRRYAMLIVDAMRGRDETALASTTFVLDRLEGPAALAPPTRGGQR